MGKGRLGVNIQSKKGALSPDGNCPKSSGTPNEFDSRGDLRGCTPIVQFQWGRGIWRTYSSKHGRSPFPKGKRIGISVRSGSRGTERQKGETRVEGRENFIPVAGSNFGGNQGWGGMPFKRGLQICFSSKGGARVRKRMEILTTAFRRKKRPSNSKKRALMNFGFEKASKATCRDEGKAGRNQMKGSSRFSDEKVGDNLKKMKLGGLGKPSGSNSPQQNRVLVAEGNRRWSEDTAVCGKGG